MRPNRGPGRAFLGSVEVPYPEYSHAEERPVSLYVRPHEVDLEPVADGAAGWPARVLHVNPAGAVVRIHLLAVREDVVVNVQMATDRWSALGLGPGDTVHVAPRRVRVFEPEYSI